MAGELGEIGEVNSTLKRTGLSGVPVRYYSQLIRLDARNNEHIP